jgi:hypothetical protein
MTSSGHILSHSEMELSNYNNMAEYGEWTRRKRGKGGANLDRFYVRANPKISMFCRLNSTVDWVRWRRGVRVRVRGEAGVSGTPFRVRTQETSRPGVVVAIAPRPRAIICHPFRMEIRERGQCIPFHISTPGRADHSNQATRRIRVGDEGGVDALGEASGYASSRVQTMIPAWAP